MVNGPLQVIVLGGPNGAGKSTVSERVLKNALSITTFVNADVIAKGPCTFARISVPGARRLASIIAEVATRHHRSDERDQDEPAP